MMLTRGRASRLPCPGRGLFLDIEVHVGRQRCNERRYLTLVAFQSQASFRRTKVLLIDMSAGSAPRTFGTQPIMSYCPA